MHLTWMGSRHAEVMQHTSKHSKSVYCIKDPWQLADLVGMGIYTYFVLNLAVSGMVPWTG